MGARSGDLDPSILLYLMEKENLSTTQMSEILNKKSGLYGMSKISPDARDIEDGLARGDYNATLALDVFHYLTACYITRCVVAMGGIDVLTFTAGVGERGPISRKGICDMLGFLGVKIDEVKNDVKAEEREISAKDSKVRIFIVPTNEELMIAKETQRLVEDR